MSSHEKTVLTRINNFYCGLHLLVGLADAAEAVLKAWETNVCEIGDLGHKLTSKTTLTQLSYVHIYKPVDLW